MKDILLNYRLYLFLAVLFLWCKTVSTLDLLIRYKVVCYYAQGFEEDYAVSLEDFFGDSKYE